jgi:hypothetical protein
VPRQSGTRNEEITSVNVRANGLIEVLLRDGMKYQSGQILLQILNRPERLSEVKPSIYSNWKDAGPLTIPVAPRSSSAGSLSVGELNTL